MKSFYELLSTSRGGGGGGGLAVLIFLAATTIRPCYTFSPQRLHSRSSIMRYSDVSSPLVVLQMTKKNKKVSMSEKRKHRQAKQRGASRTNPFADLPPSKLDLQRTPASSAVLDADKEQDAPIHMSDPQETANKAKELLKNQRASVDMLTMVGERVASCLPLEEFASVLETDGYYVVDGFLGEETILAQLEREVDALYSDGALQVDMSNLGSGEYTVAIKGGTEQYTACPRMVEWVVSTTKHVPERMAPTNSLSLDPSACMATLRTFDRKAFEASLTLLTGNDEVPEQMTKPFTKIVTNFNEDKRRLTLQYYLVPDSWDEACGGGLTFENSGANIPAKRDRLVVWKSDVSSVRKEMWKGNEEMPLGSCLELHLVQKSE